MRPSRNHHEIMLGLYSSLSSPLSQMSGNSYSYHFLSLLLIPNYIFIYSTYTLMYCPITSVYFFCALPFSQFQFTFISLIFLTFSLLFLLSTYLNSLNLFSLIFLTISTLIRVTSSYMFILNSTQLSHTTHPL